MSSERLKQAATGQVAVTPIAKFGAFMGQLKPQMELALPKHMNADRMVRLAMTAFSTTPALQKCTFQSIAGSIMTASQLGLEPGVMGQAYLIPYGTTCQLVPGWKGLVDLASRSGRSSVWTGAVRKGDAFEYQLGDAPYCRHKPGDGDDDAPFTHVYAIGRVRDSSMAIIEVWSRAKVERHLQRYNKVGARHYAKTDENNFEMYARKVALLQVLKYMPASIELANAITIDNSVEAGKGAVLEGDFVSVLDPVGGDAAEAPPPPATKGGDTVEDAKPAGKKTDPPKMTYAQFAEKLNACSDAETAGLIVDDARESLPADQLKELGELWERKFGGKP